jgi:hypothetical protein
LDRVYFEKKIATLKSTISSLNKKIANLTKKPVLKGAPVPTSVEDWLFEAMKGRQWGKCENISFAYGRNSQFNSNELWFNSQPVDARRVSAAIEKCLVRGTLEQCSHKIKNLMANINSNMGVATKPRYTMKYLEALLGYSCFKLFQKPRFEEAVKQIGYDWEVSSYSSAPYSGMGVGVQSKDPVSSGSVDVSRSVIKDGTIPVPKPQPLNRKGAKRAKAPKGAEAKTPQPTSRKEWRKKEVKGTLAAKVEKDSLDTVELDKKGLPTAMEGPAKMKAALSRKKQRAQEARQRMLSGEKRRVLKEQQLRIRSTTLRVDQNATVSGASCARFIWRPKQVAASSSLSISPKKHKKTESLQSDSKKKNKIRVTWAEQIYKRYAANVESDYIPEED